MEKNKQLLKEKGYCSFNLYEFDKESLQKINYLKCNDDKNIKEYITNLRLDIRPEESGPSLNVSEFFDSFQEAKKKSENIIEANPTGEISQMWYYKEANEILPKLGKEDSELLELKNIFKKIVNYFYDNIEYDNIDVQRVDFTYYDKKCMIESHRDGGNNEVRICNILIYLNESYDENYGGLLILDDEKQILPIFGNVGIIDLKKYDTKHEVTKVVDGPGRYAMLGFISIKN
jgi:Rps23 Pro-64 3,4-dihydroxylase Tpa1-like proline 4-hydroxylase